MFFVNNNVDVLVLGGTRLLGRVLVEKLLSKGYNVTVLSRRTEKRPSRAVSIRKEKTQGLKSLYGKRFDLTLDFIAYDDKSTKEVYENIEPGVYILISSVWVANSKMFEVAYEYLLGKTEAEAIALNKRKSDKKSTVLRLPIFWDKGEHTGRLEFYCQRVSDGLPVILVDGGNNLAQIAWTEDIANAMLLWIKNDLPKERSVWEAIPNEGVEVKDIVKSIARGRKTKPKLIDISKEMLSKKLPQYLDEEPLWREEALAITNNNLFLATGVKPTPQLKWIEKIAGETMVSSQLSDLRLNEKTFLEGII